MSLVTTEDGQTTFPVTAQKDGGLKVTIDPDGDYSARRYTASVNGIPCYSGEPGQGDILVPNGETGVFSFSVPALPLGQYDLVISDGDGNTLDTQVGGVVVVAQEFRSGTTKLRNNLSSQWQAGYRSVIQEDFPQ